MCKRFDEWSNQIEEYCDKHALSFEKAKKMSQCWGADDLILQYFDVHKKNESGLLNDTPMPVVLKITKTNNGIEFEQTEYTQKYLAAR